MMKLPIQPDVFLIGIVSRMTDQKGFDLVAYILDELLEKENILVLPGSFLSRVDRGINPGSGYVRLALVYEEEIIRESLLRIKQCL